MDTAPYPIYANADPSRPVPRKPLFQQSHPPEHYGQNCTTGFVQNSASCHIPPGYSSQQPQNIGYGQNFGTGYAPGPPVASQQDLESLAMKFAISEQRLGHDLKQMSNALSQTTEYSRNLEASMNCALRDVIANTCTVIKFSLDSHEKTFKDCLDAKKFVFELGCENRVQAIEEKLDGLENGHHTLSRTMKQVSDRVKAAQETINKLEQKANTMFEAVLKTLQELTASVVTKDDLVSFRDVVMQQHQTLREDTTKSSGDILKSLVTLQESVVTTRGLVQNNKDSSAASRQTLHGLQACMATKDDLVKNTDEILDKQQTLHDKREEVMTSFKRDILQRFHMLQESVVSMHNLAHNKAPSSEATPQTPQKPHRHIANNQCIPEALRTLQESILAIQDLTRNNANPIKASVQRLESIVAGLERGPGYTDEKLKEFFDEVKNSLGNIASLIGAFSNRVNIVVGPTVTTRAAKRKRNSR